MTTRAVVTRRGSAPSEMAAAFEASDARDLGVAVETRLPQGILVQGSDEQYSELEARGYRVKILPDTNVLDIGAYRIDTESGPPPVPQRLDVARTQQSAWPHHLVQLSAPPNEEWIRAIEERGVDVVEPVSAYGVFVAGSADRVDALQELPFVQWVGPFKPAYRISPNVRGLKGRIQYLSVGVYPSSEIENVKAALAQFQAKVIREERMPAPYGGEFGVLITEVDAKHTNALAALPQVRWLEYQPPMEPAGERETQIVAENLDGTANPVVGYQAWLAGVSLSGAGVTVAIADTGIDANANNNATGHTDLRGRQLAFVDYTGGTVATDTNGHGTNVAGIAVGNAATGQAEAVAPANFLWGQGVAPQASYVTQNFLLANPQPSTATLIQDAAANGAQVMNNSWGVNDSGGTGYTAGSRTIDLAVRDPNSAAAGLQNMAIVCAAGNSGGRLTSINQPHESKNDIVVGNSLTSRPGLFPADDVRGIAGTSSRGPAVDGRIMPTVVAPGTDVSAPLSRTAAALTPIPGTGTPDPMNPANLIDQYVFMTGTSQAAPHVAGTCALLIEWWRDRTGQSPSPALLKALLVNGAEDLAGGENWRCLNRVAVDKSTWSLESGSIFRRNMTFTPTAVVQGQTVLTQVASVADITAAGQWFFDAATNRLFVRMNGNTNPGASGVNFLHARDAQPLPAIPNGHQGWGRVSLPNIISQFPTSDRGPKLFSDQRHAFTANGQEHVIRVAPVDTGRPLRITVAWTDAAGAAGANPALVNDLDLEVLEVATGNIYRGNVFANGFSTTGGAFDNRNNVECVYIQAPSGTYEITVIAANIAASARPDIATPWQDFALVIDNAEAAEAEPVSVVPVIDRSGSMVAAGYVDVTRTSSKQFVDLMGVDDRVGVVSFGSTSTVEYSAPGPALQTITGQPEKEAAKAEIDGIAFGGCTFMGAGINDGRNLLNAAAGGRAMVLLSDGYDNKGCDAGNPAKPSAMQAVAGLPANMPVYACAMGPASDQTLLEQIATASGGRYYYMPTIDDLFEIYNYIRGQITGDSIIVNQSAMASSSSVAAFVDAFASEATFSVAWADERLRYVGGAPRKSTDVSVRLRTPRGELLPSDSSYVRRIVGSGYVAFKLQDPEPGQWFVEVSTAGDTHVRYTVGGFVKSPLRLVAEVRPRQFVVGAALHIGTKVFDGKRQVTGIRSTAQVVRPTLGIPSLMTKFRTQLRDTQPIKVPGGDVLPSDIARLFALRNKMLAAKKPDILGHTAVPVSLRSATVADLKNIRFADWIPDLTAQPVSESAAGPTLPIRLPSGPALPTLGGARVLAASFRDTNEPGSYNVAVTVTGSAAGATRFVRKDMISVVIR